MPRIGGLSSLLGYGTKIKFAPGRFDVQWEEREDPEYEPSRWYKREVIFKE